MHDRTQSPHEPVHRAIRAFLRDQQCMIRDDDRTRDHLIRSILPKMRIFKRRRINANARESPGRSQPRRSISAATRDSHTRIARVHSHQRVRSRIRIAARHVDPPHRTRSRPIWQTRITHRTSQLPDVDDAFADLAGRVLKLIQLVPTEYELRIIDDQQMIVTTNLSRK